MKKLVEILKVNLLFSRLALALLCVMGALFIFPREGLAANDCSNPPPAPQAAGKECDPTLACFTITSPGGEITQARLPQKPCEGNYVCRPHKTATAINTCQCAFGSIEMPLPGIPTFDICQLTGRGTYGTPFAALIGIMDTIAGYVTAVIVALGLVMIVIGGYSYMMAGGDGNSISRAKNIMGAAVLGITLALISWLILNTVSDQFTQPPDPLSNQSQTP